MHFLSCQWKRCTGSQRGNLDSRAGRVTSRLWVLKHLHLLYLLYKCRQKKSEEKHAATWWLCFTLSIVFLLWKSVRSAPQPLLALGASPSFSQNKTAALCEHGSVPSCAPPRQIHKYPARASGSGEFSFFTFSFSFFFVWSLDTVIATVASSPGGK